MNTNRHCRTGRPPGFAIGLTVVGYAMSLVALVCFEQNRAPWDIQWLNVHGINAGVLAALDAARLEVAAAALVTLNFILLFLRRWHRPAERVTVPLAVQDDTQLQAEDSTRVGLAAESRLEQHRIPIQSDSSSANSVTSDSKSGALPLSQSAGVALRGAAPNRSMSHAETQMQIATDEIGRLRRELVSCKQQLDTANNAKAQFLANMSHELRTPMNGIMGMTDLLLGSPLEEREERFVRSIASSSTSLLSIINDLLDFSRIESGILQLEHGRFSLRDCLEDVCASLAGTAHIKNIELICYVDDNVPSHMEGDPGRVRQILNNLINNAIAFTEEGEVVVRLSRKDSLKDSGKDSGNKNKNGQSVYHCDVQDTGVGITPELQLKLFEAFTQADASNTRDHGGLGMGLAITRQLVSMMNGEISFRSRLREGSRFSFSMELDDVSDADDAQTRRRPLQGAYALVVDDNETNRSILYHQLSNWGLIVETVESGELALQAMHAAHDRGQGFDVLILDLHMPHMDGIQLAKAIQAEPDFQHIQSIMLTSAILQIDGTELRRLGINKYVSKPARQSVLHDSLASLMPLLGAQTLPAEEPSGPDEAGLPLINAKVLLVEDNPVNQDVAMGMLEQLGCEVELATDGNEAVSKVAEKKYDLVLMDCQMPLMDGYEATRIIKSGTSINAPTPIIALTANAMNGDREKCLLAGMDDYVAKPVRTLVLSHMLQKWLSKPLQPFDKDAHSSAPALVVTGDSEGVLVSDNIVVNTDSDDAHAPSTAEVPELDDEVSEEVPELDDEVSELDAEAGIINLKAIDTIRGLQRTGKPDLLGKVVGIFFDKAPELISSMRNGLTGEDYHLISSSAHSLKSSSAYLGADVLFQTCRQVESAIAENRHAELESLIATIESDYEPVATALAEFTEHKDQAA